MSDTIEIRPARGEDVAAIDGLFLRTFPAPEEARLVRDLCIDGDMVLMLVATEEYGTVVGSVAFSRMAVEVNAKSVPSVALAPVAVERDYRRQGIAEALIQAGLERLEQEGVVLCFVLGEPDYYGRFGFAADVASGFESPYAGDYFMATPLQGGLIPCGVRGRADHAGAFARLGQAE
ncbi:GNAT family N-acetyltransferase [Sphingomonas montanisoli]|uniref:N-acetyltransferase n=1 Tax=Sphingomonas montanisoli TaxID=2606412 RepID=A0A5D9C0E0_9SPHN|nr:N-acetyltransferase [Sphingomonas montanisoli]TZG25119.1 N-acetyltransferase [Sphingomonas montanisoli]